MIYLDNAATTFPKPQCVNTEIERCLKEYCGNPGRSGHILSLKAAEKIYLCREAISKMFGGAPERVIFTFNATYALNIAIKALIKKDSHILISNMEHNSVFRVINNLYENNYIEYGIFNVMQSTEKILNELTSKVKYNTDMLILTHASNICGKVFPVEKIGKFCKRNQIKFIVDASQSAGTVKTDIAKLGTDALCAPAHKGLYGPQGLGFVIFGEKCSPQKTIIEGGTGNNSLSPFMGNVLPEAFEAGTLPTPLIAGTLASIKWISSIGESNIQKKEVFLASKLKERLLSIPGSVIPGPEIPENGIVLFSSANQERIYDELNKHNICTRNGLHCAPLAHKTLGTLNKGGIRFSFSFFNSLSEIDKVYKVIKNAT